MENQDRAYVGNALRARRSWQVQLISQGLALFLWLPIMVALCIAKLAHWLLLDAAFFLKEVGVTFQHVTTAAAKCWWTIWRNACNKEREL
jgi:hypothetical protein